MIQIDLPCLHFLIDRQEKLLSLKLIVLKVYNAITICCNSLRSITTVCFGWHVCEKAVNLLVNLMLR